MNTPPSFIESAFADPASLAAAARLRVVLVGTQHPGNIGAAARALKTMGLARLVLVAPEDYPAEEAYRRAAGADDLLGDAPVVDTLAEAVADCRLVLGCTARSRRVQLEEHVPRQAAAVAVARAAAGGEVALVFGRERTGLSNEELQLCHAAVHIPANPGYSSLNLAAAVQVVAYELRVAAGAAIAPAPSHEPVTGADMEGLFGQLQGVLEASGFLAPNEPMLLMTRLRRLFYRAAPDRIEINILRGALRSLDPRGGANRRARKVPDD